MGQGSDPKGRSATISPPCSSLRLSFVKKSCRSVHRLEARFLSARVAQPAETRRRERRQCRCESCREHQYHGVEATEDRKCAIGYADQSWAGELIFIKCDGFGS